MSNNKKELISLDKVHIPRWNELPNVDLYLDQVVNYLERYLEQYAGEKEEKDFQSVTADSLKTELTAQMVGYDIISITGGAGNDFTVTVNDKDYGYTATISSTSLTLKTFKFTNETTHEKN